MSADLYHIEFECSENISNLLQGKYIEPSEATAYRQNSFCGHRSSASYALIKDIGSTALFYIRLKFDFAYEAVEDFNLLVFEAVGACYTLMDNDLLNQLVKQRGGQLRDYCVFLYQSNPPFRITLCFHAFGKSYI